MPTEIYVMHPGVGQSRSSDPANRVTKDGDEFAWLEQEFPVGAERQSFFQGVVIPPQIDTALNTTVVLTFRQASTAPSGDIYVDFLHREISDGDDRDSTALTSVGPQALTMTGVEGEEKEVSFSLPQSAFTEGDEFLMSVMRKGDDLVNDTFGGLAALVRIAIYFELLPDAGELYINPNPLTQAHGGLPVGWNFPAPGHTIKQMFDLILYPFRTPVITSFSLFDPIAIAPVATVLEVGDSIPQWTPPGTPIRQPWAPPPNLITFLFAYTDPDGHLTAFTTDVDHVSVANLGSGLPNTSPHTLQLHPNPPFPPAVAPPPPPPWNPAPPIEEGDPVFVGAAHMPSVPSTVPVAGQNRVQHRFRISMDYTRQMTPPPAPPTTFTITRDAVHSWYWRVFAGINASASLTPAQVAALGDFNALTGQVSRTYSFSATGYKYICYPESFLWATVWTDTLTGFNVPFQNIGTVPMTNAYGETINYKVQRSSNIIGAAINIAVS